MKRLLAAVCVFCFLSVYLDARQIYFSKTTDSKLKAFFPAGAYLTTCDYSKDAIYAPGYTEEWNKKIAEIKNDFKPQCTSIRKSSNDKPVNQGFTSWDLFIKYVNNRAFLNHPTKDDPKSWSLYDCQHLRSIQLCTLSNLACDYMYGYADCVGPRKNQVRSASFFIKPTLKQAAAAYSVP